MAVEFGEMKAGSSKSQAAIKSCRSAVLEKNAGWLWGEKARAKLSSRTDDLILVYWLF